jgi:hypothetical protein
MRFWAIEARPGELFVDEAVVPEAVRRISGIATVEALFLFTSRVTLDGFMEVFLPDGEADDGGPPSRQALEAAFERELQTMAGAATGRASPRFPEFDPRSLVEVLEGVSSEVGYVALDPDTPGQQVWSVEQFGRHLLELLGRAS